jgi:hypothetical protein
MRYLVTKVSIAAISDNMDELVTADCKITMFENIKSEEKKKKK